MCEAEDELYAQYGGIGVFEYVAMWRPVWIAVMRRAGMFDSATQQRPKVESTSGIDHVQSRREPRRQ